MSSGTMKEPEIDDLQMDALRELGNVGASHASTALTELVKKDILIDVTECRIFPIDALPPRFGENGKQLATVKIDVGDSGSSIVMVFPQEIATALSDLLLGRNGDPRRKISEEDKEVLVEMGDICIRRYLNPISRFLSIDIIPSSPIVSVEVIVDNVHFPENLKNLHHQNTIRIETNFVDEGLKFHGTIIYMPDKTTQGLTFKRFGVDMESQAAMFQKFGLSN